MNKILFTSHLFGADEKFNICSAINTDFSWLFNSASTLLWADKIIITPEILKVINSYPRYSPKKKLFSNKPYYINTPEIENIIPEIFGLLEDKKILEIIKISDAISNEVSVSLEKEIYLDLEKMQDLFHDRVVVNKSERIGEEIYVDGHFYCYPKLWVLYASLFLESKLNAHNILSHEFWPYMNMKMAISSVNDNITNIKQYFAFEEIFKSRIPNINLLPNVINKNEKCPICAHLEKCNSKAIEDVIGSLSQILQWREYDEIYQIREILNNIKKVVRSNPEISVEEIINLFKDEESKVQKKIYSTFPKIDRWTKMSTIISIPIALAGAFLQNPNVISVGATMAGTANATEKFIDIYKSKFRWIGFKNRIENSLISPNSIYKSYIVPSNTKEKRKSTFRLLFKEILRTKK